MPRTKSSSLAKIKDLASSLITEVVFAQAEYDILQKDSARLKEIEPALKKIRETIAAPEPPPQPPPPGQEEQPIIIPKEKVKRARHNKKKSTEEPPHETDQPDLKPD